MYLYTLLLKYLQPSDAKPQHVALIADPQLVDPHTYPGRPWPLSTLTIFFTDLYLRRSFSRITKELSPDTVFFLGDLFDGGREWSTPNYVNKDVTWQKYGQDFWLKEYERFRKIFFDTWSTGDEQHVSDPRRRSIIAGLPGNHDLGIGAGVELSVRQRFNAYFGDGNRVDIVGNHSFVSIDSVSLTAWKPADSSNEKIWKPTMEFLDNVQTTIERAQFRDDITNTDGSSDEKFGHTTFSNSAIATNEAKNSMVPKPKLPGVLLTHVPLYRVQSTPCGPLRERWPQSLDENGNLVQYDGRNAIDISAGYQYQNVLTLDVSKLVTDKIKNLSYAFSGDDHDYCDVLHTGYTSSGKGIREITVKSISFAMGVRRPGFVMLSLWNPLQGFDSSGKELDSQSTLQSNLCLLPDQLWIFITYGVALGLTLILLTLQAALKTLYSVKFSIGKSDVMNVPDDTDMLFDLEESIGSNSRYSHNDEHPSSNSSSSADVGSFPFRAANTRARSTSSAAESSTRNLQPNRHLPSLHTCENNSSQKKDEEVSWISLRKQRFGRLNGVKAFLLEFRRNVIKVGAIAVCWYLILIWRG